MFNESIALLARKYIDYDMIRKHTDLPDYPLSQTRLLYAFLCDGSRTQAQSETLALAVSLVQLGLDTHDLVDNFSSIRSSGRTMRSRQLKVLAGDYFSSRFYSLLSEAGEIETVKRVSEAICEVHRSKMDVYNKMQRNDLTAEQYINDTVEIKTRLYLSFSRMMDGVLAYIWPEALIGLTQCEVLLSEIKRLDMPRKLPASWSYWQLLGSALSEEREHVLSGDPDKLTALIRKYNLRETLVQMLGTQLSSLKEKMRSFESERLYNEMSALLQPFVRVTAMPIGLKQM